MRRPAIGITVDQHTKPDCYESPFAYAKAIEMAGGLPLLLPYQTAIALIPFFLDQLDGILLTGGNDLDPALFNEARHLKAIPLDPVRENFEFALLDEIAKRRTPTLGICLGQQIINVHRGGNLHQFLPDVPRENALEHRKLAEIRNHPVRIVLDSHIGQAIGKTEIMANTFHKQAVNVPGKRLRVVATSPDGVIEAIEDPHLPLFAAVQWHPERMIDQPEHLALFQMLVDKSRI